MTQAHLKQAGLILLLAAWPVLADDKKQAPQQQAPPQHQAPPPRQAPPQQAPPPRQAPPQQAPQRQPTQQQAPAQRPSPQQQAPGQRSAPQQRQLPSQPGSAGPASNGLGSTPGGSRTPPPAGPGTRGPAMNPAGRSPSTPGTPAPGNTGIRPNSSPSTPSGRSGSMAPSGAGRPSTPAPLARPLPKSGTVRTSNGGEIRTRADGQPRDIRLANRNLEIHHGLAGGRRIETVRADHSRVVVEQGSRGFVQRPYTYRGREFAQRTYVSRGVVSTVYYQRYPYRGVFLDVYAPVRFYPFGFYGFLYNPWTPFGYAWGWGGAPWYGYYGYYYTPYAVYGGPSLWLTDYMFSAALADSYQAQLDANGGGAPPPPWGGADALTPQVKQFVASEVQRQLQMEGAEAQAAAQNGAPDPANDSIARLLSDGQKHVFVAGRDLDVLDSDNHECAVTSGDVLQLAGPPPPDATAASLVVLASKGGPDCRQGSVVAVSLVDLQEMQNYMRATLDQGLAELQAKAGQGGLPALPAAALAAPVQAPFAAAAPPPDQNAATQISQQAQEGERAEQQAIGEATGAPPDPSQPQPPGPASGPVTISMGQSIDEVVAILGNPKNIVDLGVKKIYVYQDMKITFQQGKVADVQ